MLTTHAPGLLTFLTGDFSGQSGDRAQSLWNAWEHLYVASPLLLRALASVTDAPEVKLKFLRQSDPLSNLRRPQSQGRPAGWLDGLAWAQSAWALLHGPGGKQRCSDRSEGWQELGRGLRPPGRSWGLMGGPRGLLQAGLR